MKKRYLETSALHQIPADVRTALLSSLDRVRVWNDITPLARNEWLCWIISAKKPETRQRRMERMGRELLGGKRRPCCFAGCPHR